MEDVADALKIVFGVVVFALGIVMLFNMSSQARETSRIIISEMDETRYYDYYTNNEDEQAVDKDGNRIVTMQDIIPVLYRYSQENYGVTIVDKDGNIVTRFDLDTERACNAWDDVTKIENNKTLIDNTIRTFKRVNELANKTIINVDKYDEIGEFTDLFKQIYRQAKDKAGITKEYECYWTANAGCVAQRIDSDLSRNNS